VYLVRYAGGQVADVMSVDEMQRRVTVRRVEAIDAMMEQIRSQRNLLPLDLPEGYASQMMALVRRVERDELDKVVVRYVSVGEDDYGHAEAYDVVAREMWNLRQVVAEDQREVIQPLDDLMEFQRAAMDPDDYMAGPDEGDWSLD
jgi:hypothetical protein